MKKTKEAVKRQLKENWEKACNGYLVELLRMWGLDGFYGYWIGDEVGGVYDYGSGMFTLNMDEIIYCVENDVTEAEVMVWQEYVCDAGVFGFDIPDLKSWHRGCPRVGVEVFEKLRGMKAEIDKIVEEEKARVKGGGCDGIATYGTDGTDGTDGKGCCDTATDGTDGTEAGL
jgi:hypothetical protein